MPFAQFPHQSSHISAETAPPMPWLPAGASMRSSGSFYSLRSSLQTAARGVTPASSPPTSRQALALGSGQYAPWQSFKTVRCLPPLAEVHRRACPPFQHPACLLSLVAPAYIPPTPLVCLSLQNFPSSRGSVVGVLKAAIGLSGARSHASAVQAFCIANWVKCVILRHRRHPLVHNMPGGQHAIALPTALLASPCRLPVCVGLLGSVLWGQGLLPAVPGAGPGGGGPAGTALGEQLKKSSMMCAWGSAGRSF